MKAAQRIAPRKRLMASQYLQQLMLLAPYMPNDHHIKDRGQAAHRKEWIFVPG